MDKLKFIYYLLGSIVFTFIIAYGTISIFGNLIGQSFVPIGNLVTDFFNTIGYYYSSLESKYPLAVNITIIVVIIVLMVFTLRKAFKTNYWVINPIQK